MKKYDIGRYVFLCLTAGVLFLGAPTTQAQEPEVCAFGYCGPTDCVYVRSKGNVSKEHFSCDTIESSTYINEVCYDSANEYMLMQLDQAYVQYCGIADDVVNSLINASEKEKFYNRFIKRQYSCATTPPPEYEDKCQ